MKKLACVNGILLLASVMLIACGGSSGDIKALAVSSTSPADGEKAVLINSTIAAIFSKGIDCATVNSTSFTVNDDTDDTPVSGTVTCFGVFATFTPNADLGEKSLHTATILNTVKDNYGNRMELDYTWSFTTEDITAPTVTLDPGDGGVMIAVTNVVKATFDEVVLCSTVNSTSFTLDDDAGAPVTGTVGCASTSYTTATFTPDADLDGSTNYTATVSNAITDVSGNVLVLDETTSFKTAMTVASTSPIDGATNVALDSVLTAVFSDTLVDCATITTSSLTLYDETAAYNVSGTITSCTGGSVTFTPDLELIEQHNYSATMASTVKDSDANAMLADHTWNFDTGADTTAPVIGTITPSNNATATHVDGSFDLSATVTDNGSVVTGCEYTTNNGSTWIPATLTGTFPDYICTKSGIAGTDGQVLTLNMSATSSGGTGVSSAITRTVDTTAPTVVSTVPPEGAPSYPWQYGFGITIHFDEPVLCSTVTKTSLLLYGRGSLHAKATLYCTGVASDQIAYYYGPLGLYKDTDYTLYITTDVTDDLGNALDGDGAGGRFTLSFHTSP